MLNPGSERNIISICLKDQSKLLDLENEHIILDHFSVPAHKYIYTAMTYLASKQIKPTPMALIEVLTSESVRKAVEDMGGLEYLILLEESNVPTENLPIFIAKLKQAYTRKSLYQICKETMAFMTSSSSESLNPAELLGVLEGKLVDLSVASDSKAEVYKMGDDTERVLDERAENPEEVPGLEVGMAEYDKVTNGAVGGDCIVVCAESKTGKSVLLTNWAEKIAIQDQLPVLYIDTEMSSREQEDRLLSIMTGIPHHEVVSGMYVLDTPFGTAQDKCSRLKAARMQLGMGNYYHIYMPHFTIEKVTALAKQFVRQVGIVALFFDYIKIPSSAKGGKNEQEYQALGYFTSGLKDIAGTLNIPVFTACQANRDDLGSTEKDAKAIGGSYRILQLASKLMFLTNKTDEQIAKDGLANGNQVLQIKYQRNGASDVKPINIFFDRPIIRMKEAN